jgi:hypothetical protein
MTITAVGTLSWERAGGPRLTLGERVALLANAGLTVSACVAQRLWHQWFGGRQPPRVDLTRWEPPDSAISRSAEQCVRESTSPQMLNHSFRAYWFSAAVCELAHAQDQLDRESLYVAALLHDVALAKPRPDGVQCFTVACAREARRLMAGAGWEQARQDKVALAIVSNLNVRVPTETFGAEAHWFTAGGLVEVLAQSWRIHPDNLSEILRRYPRTGYIPDVLAHVARETQLDPGGRFACLGPIFPAVVRRMRFPGDDGARAAAPPTKR